MGSACAATRVGDDRILAEKRPSLGSPRALGERLVKPTPGARKVAWRTPKKISSLREVDEELQQDKQLEAFKKYGPWLGALAAAAVIGVGAVQIRGSMADKARAESAEAYQTALDAGEAGPAAGAEALIKVAGELNDGYAALAKLRAAGLLVNDGKPDEARSLYADIYNSGGIPNRLKDLARLRAAAAVLDVSSEEAARIASGVKTDAFKPFASEIEAIAALDRGDYDTAYAALLSLRDDETAPQGLKGRVGVLFPLADAGRQGVSLAPKASDADAFIESFTDQLGDDGLLDLPDDPPSPGDQ